MVDNETNVNKIYVNSAMTSAVIVERSLDFKPPKGHELSDNISANSFNGLMDDYKVKVKVDRKLLINILRAMKDDRVSLFAMVNSPLCIDGNLTRAFIAPVIEE